jgi:hypothetical protein
MVSTFWGTNEEENEEQEEWNENCIGFNLNLSKSQMLLKTTECLTLSFLLLNNMGIFPEYEIKRLH